MGAVGVGEASCGGVQLPVARREEEDGENMYRRRDSGCQVMGSPRRRARRGMQ